MTDTASTIQPVHTVMNMALGYLMSRSLHVATELAIADHLGDGPRTAQELAPHPGKVMDILMMVFATGRERTAQEFAALFEAAGLRPASVTPTASTLSVVEARIA